MISNLYKPPNKSNPSAINYLEFKPDTPSRPATQTLTLDDDIPENQTETYSDQYHPRMHSNDHRQVSWDRTTPGDYIPKHALSESAEKDIISNLLDQMDPTLTQHQHFHNHSQHQNNNPKKQQLPILLPNNQHPQINEINGSIIKQYNYSPYYQPVIPKLNLSTTNGGGNKSNLEPIGISCGGGGATVSGGVVNGVNVVPGGGVGGGGYFYPAGESVFTQLERVKGLLRDKEYENLKIRHENAALKQVERRQQKDIAQLTTQSEDAPRIIRGLREEIIGLKSKLREYFNTTTNDSRHIRHLNDEIQKLKDHNKKLDALVQEQDLSTRDILAKEIVFVREQLVAKEKYANEISKHAELLEKNLTLENRQLRLKLHALENENCEFKEKIDHLDDTIHDKDKEIASLSIYRYNAVHRKSENSCKLCQKREKDEQELIFRNNIIENFPKLRPPQCTVIKLPSESLEGPEIPSCISVIVSIPPRTLQLEREGGDLTEQVKNENLSYNSIFVHWTDNLNEIRGNETQEASDPKIRKNELEVVNFNASHDRTSSVINSYFNSKHPNDYHHNDKKSNKSEIKWEITNLNEEHDANSDNKYQIKIFGLDIGKVYYFGVKMRLGDIDSKLVWTEEPVVFDTLLPPIPKPTCYLIPHARSNDLLTPPSSSIQICFLPNVHDPKIASRPFSYKIYHSIDSFKSHSELIAILDPPNESSDSETTHTYHPIAANKDNSFILYTHTFQVTAINKCGESPRSNISDAIFIDYVPENVIISNVSVSQNNLNGGENTVSIFGSVVNFGSKLHSIKLMIEKRKLGETQQSGIVEIREIPVDSKELVISGNDSLLQFVIKLDKLEVGVLHKFKLSASNQCGESEYFVYEKEVLLGSPIPIPPTPSVKILSPTSFQVNFEKLPNTMDDTDTHAKFKNIKIRVESAKIDTQAAEFIAPVENSTVTCENLEFGETYFVSLAYVSENEVGSFSPRNQVPLAAGISIPESRPSSAIQQITSQQQTQLPQSQIYTTNSSSQKNSLTNLSLSRLSLSEKVENMHMGMPANYISPESTGQTQSDSSGAINTTANSGSMTASAVPVGLNSGVVQTDINKKDRTVQQPTTTTYTAAALQQTKHALTQKLQQQVGSVDPRRGSKITGVQGKINDTGLLMKKNNNKKIG
ncbi:Lebercilin [Nowakowskiella sp. JEL0407]|nr:Lebercilin [Nowakowskiella sp. JEL0407]